MIGHYCLVPFDGGNVQATDWIETPNATGPVDIVAAKCDLVAHGSMPSGGGFIAVGSTAFVGTAAAGAAIGQGVSQMNSVQSTIRDCMIINGFKHKDHSSRRESLP